MPGGVTAGGGARPPVHAAVRAGEVGGERRGQRGEESTGETCVGDVDGAGLRVGSGVVDVEVLALFSHRDLVGVEPVVTGVRGLGVEPVAPPAIRFAEIAARRSMCTLVGTRDWRRNISSRSRRTCPRLTSLNGGNAGGSA